MYARTLPVVLVTLLGLACDNATIVEPVPLSRREAAGALSAENRGLSSLAVPGRPLAGSFEGAQSVTVTPPTASVQVSAAGTATQLGRFTIELPHTVHLPTSTAQGTATIVAANGDVIVATFTGQAQLGPLVHIVEHATITGGTGRFEGASGSFVMERVFDPAAGRTTGSLSGTISTPHGN